MGSGMHLIKAILNNLIQLYENRNDLPGHIKGQVPIMLGRVSSSTPSSRLLVFALLLLGFEGLTLLVGLSDWITCDDRPNEEGKWFIPPLLLLCWPWAWGWGWLLSIRAGLLNLSPSVLLSFGFIFIFLEFPLLFADCRAATHLHSYGPGMGWWLF